MATIAQIFESWRATAELHSLGPGTGTEEIEVFEETAGWKLPAEWRELYALVNGARLFRDNLYVHPLLGDDNSLLESSEAYRHEDWQVPQQLWIAGGDGEGNPFGLWLPLATPSTALVVELWYGISPDKHLTIVGSSLSAFLLERTLYHLLCHFEGDTPPLVAFNTLGAPLELQSLEPTFDPNAMQAIERWADPHRPVATTLSEIEENLRRQPE